MKLKITYIPRLLLSTTLYGISCQLIYGVTTVAKDYNMLTDPKEQYNSHFPWTNNAAYVTGQKIYLRGGSPQGGKNCLTVDGASGNVGIGTESPGVSLEVRKGSPSSAPDIIKFGDSAGFAYLGAGSTYFGLADQKQNTRLAILQSNGNVGVGTNNPTEKLAVNGKVRAKEIIVEPSGWSDHVFSQGYELKPLYEVENYIENHGHLPDIPSADEVDKEGVSLGEINAKLLQKVEELTLYAIEQQKQNSSLHRMIEKQQRQIEFLMRLFDKSQETPE